MTDKRKLTDLRQDYSEEQLYGDLAKQRKWKEKDYQGGQYSDSEVGGECQDQQNSWQGPQSDQTNLRQGE